MDPLIEQLKAELRFVVENVKTQDSLIPGV
jgi:hypothetical protein